MIVGCAVAAGRFEEDEQERNRSHADGATQRSYHHCARGKTPWVRLLETGDIAALWASGPGDVWAVGSGERVLHAP